MNVPEFPHGTLGNFISWAWGYQDWEVAGPKWRDYPTDVIYDIAAKTASPVPESQLKLMLQPAWSIPRWALHVVNHDDINLTLLRLQLETELLPHSLLERRSVRVRVEIHIGRREAVEFRRPFQGEVECSAESRLIRKGAVQDGHPAQRVQNERYHYISSAYAHSARLARLHVIDAPAKSREPARGRLGRLLRLAGR